MMGYFFFLNVKAVIIIINDFQTYTCHTYHIYAYIQDIAPVLFGQGEGDPVSQSIPFD